MAWERNFEARILKIREKELRFQKRNYTIEVWTVFASLRPALIDSFVTLGRVQRRLVGTNHIVNRNISRSFLLFVSF